MEWHVIIICVIFPPILIIMNIATVVYIQSVLDVRFPLAVQHCES